MKNPMTTIATIPLHSRQSATYHGTNAQSRKLPTSMTGGRLLPKVQKKTQAHAPEKSPTKMDPSTQTKKVAIASKTSSAVMATFVYPSKRFTNVSKAVIATPSFKRLSPKTNIKIVSDWFMFRLVKTLKIATGSIEDISVPKTNESSIGIVVLPLRYDAKCTIRPVVILLKMVPTKAKIRIAPLRLLNSRLLTDKAASNIIGGSKTLKNKSSSKLRSSILSVKGTVFAITPQSVPTNIHVAASGRNCMPLRLTATFAHSASSNTNAAVKKWRFETSLPSSQ
mmetsp:Transcript_35432/g.42728  ORF Transcript_35432/g.42728 Transcript_35432/m.42728 type:complete len:281 (-) Transcript_35432:73-915(-)